MAGYRALGQWHEVTLISLTAVQAAQPVFRTRAGRAAPTAMMAAAAPMDAGSITVAVNASPVLSSRIFDPASLAVVQGAVPARPSFGARVGGRVSISTYDALTMVGQTVIAEGLRQADLAAAKSYGAAVIEEGLDGKMLLRVDSVDKVFGLVDLLLKREVGSASPNFLRRIVPVRLGAGAAAWSHTMIGVAEAWAITRGSTDVRIAVLDEGVDTSHPSLKAAVFAERDFVGGNGNSAMPSANDAHGTACAGIAVSRDKTFPGIAPRCSLIAARIAMDDGHGNWIFDDFSTAEAIDWSWRQGAAVLSNSWGGGAPSDAISRAFARARTQGREGLGSVVVIAAGNDQAPIDFPGDLPGYVTVGASNPADERKTRTSSDGENWWGSNFGATMHILAPGVFIWTTDISGPTGYELSDFTKTFNGTSSATPAVAGAAALMLSANPALSAASVRDLLAKTAKKLNGQTVWTPELGWGRLDVAKAVAAAQIAGAPKPPKKPKKTTKKVKTSPAKKAKTTQKSRKAPARKRSSKR